MPGPLRVLLLSDDSAGAEPLTRALAAAGFAPGLARLTNAPAPAGAWDAVVADPPGTAMGALAAIRARFPDLPVVVVLDAGCEAHGVELIRHGADDWVEHDRLGRLGHAVSMAVERRCLQAELSAALAARQAAEERLFLFTTAVDSASDAITITRADMHVLYQNPAWAAHLGYTVDELNEIGLLTVYRSPRKATEVTQAVRGGRPWHGEVELVAKDGRIVPTWLRCDSIRDETGALRGYIAVDTDITERKRAEAEIRFQAALLDQVQAAVIGTDLEARVTHWNRQAESLYGWRRREAIGHPLTELIVPAGGEAEAESLLDRVRTDGLPPAEHLARRKDGSTVPVLTSATAIRDDAGAVVGLVGVSIDLTERKAWEDQLRDLAFRDQLTGLPNRAAFQERLRAAVAEPSADGRATAVLVVDVHRFRVVNDTLGHQAGDRVLRAVAERLQRAVGAGVLLARAGDDHFALLVPDASVRRTRAVAERALAALRRSFDVGDRETFVRAAVGIAIGEAPADGEEVLRRANVALNEAKASGPGSVVVFDPSFDARAVDRLAQETALRNAVELEQFVVHFQPIVSLSSGRLVGVEALVRWLHPGRGLLSPDAFLPLAEESDLIVPIGEWVMREACRQAACWPEQPASEPFFVAVNVSPRQLDPDRFGARVRQVLTETGLPPDRLVVEVTEDAIGKDAEGAVALLADLRALGVRPALDDFGAGYSSFARLGRLPLEPLKIDRGFIDRLDSDARGANLVRTMTALGHDLGLTVVAEGIEREEQARLARELGCDLGQGYLFGRPDFGDALAARWLPAPAEPDGRRGRAAGHARRR